MLSGQKRHWTKVVLSSVEHLLGTPTANLAARDLILIGLSCCVRSINSWTVRRDKYLWTCLQLEQLLNYREGPITMMKAEQLSTQVPATTEEFYSGKPRFNGDLFCTVCRVCYFEVPLVDLSIWGIYFAKISIRFFDSRSYLTNASAAKL